MRLKQANKFFFKPAGLHTFMESVEIFYVLAYAAPRIIDHGAAFHYKGPVARLGEQGVRAPSG